MMIYCTGIAYVFHSHNLVLIILLITSFSTHDYFICHACSTLLSYNLFILVLRFWVLFHLCYLFRFLMIRIFFDLSQELDKYSGRNFSIRKAKAHPLQRFKVDFSVTRVTRWKCKVGDDMCYISRSKVIHMILSITTCCRGKGKHSSTPYISY